MNQKGINVKDLIGFDKIFIDKQSITEITKEAFIMNKYNDISLDKAYDVIKKPITTEKSTNFTTI